MPREDRREPREDRREPREAHHSPIYLDAAAGVPMQRPALAAWLAAAAAPPDPAAAARAATMLAKAMATEGGFDLDSASANVFAFAKMSRPRPPPAASDGAAPTTCRSADRQRGRGPRRPRSEMALFFAQSLD